jgi:hypothetical protein
VSDLMNRIEQMLGAMASPHAFPPVAWVVTCPGCKQRNRVVTGKKSPQCGKCGLPLVKP